MASLPATRCTSPPHHPTTSPASIPTCILVQHLSLPLSTPSHVLPPVPELVPTSPALRLRAPRLLRLQPIRLFHLAILPGESHLSRRQCRRWSQQLCEREHGQHGQHGQHGEYGEHGEHGIHGIHVGREIGGHDGQRGTVVGGVWNRRV
jgi:hypothetical protein